MCVLVAGRLLVAVPPTRPERGLRVVEAAPPAALIAVAVVHKRVHRARLACNLFAADVSVR